MLTETLKTLFERDLKKLKLELEAYQDEHKIWIINKDIKNSAGNLCLHLIGNLNTYVGAILGNTGYIRNRELEFSLKDIPRSELLIKIEETISIVNMVLSGLTEQDLNLAYPQLVFKEKTSTEFFLVHLSTHLAYHLGQVNYHRRLV